MNHETDGTGTVSPLASDSTPNPLPSFDTPRLGMALEALSVAELDSLPFGVIGLDPDGTVRVYNRAEAQQSGYKNRPAMGCTFFTDVAPCMDNPYFKGRIDKARQGGMLDIRFSFVGDFAERDRELNVRVQAAKDGGTWICHQRAAYAE